MVGLTGACCACFAHLEVVSALLAPLVLPGDVGGLGAARGPVWQGVRGEVGGEVVEGPKPCPSRSATVGLRRWGRCCLRRAIRRLRERELAPGLHGLRARGARPFQCSCCRFTVKFCNEVHFVTAVRNFATAVPAQFPEGNCFMARAYFRPAGVRRYIGAGGVARYVRRVRVIRRPTVRRLGAFRSFGTYEPYVRLPYYRRRR